MNESILTNRHVRCCALFLVLGCLWGGPLEAQTRPWITAYYPHWWYAELNPVTGVDYTKLSHIVIFSSNPVRTPPYLDILVSPKDSEQIEYGILTGQPAPYLKETVTNAHKYGVKVLLSVGGIAGEGQQNMAWIAQDPQRIDVFVQAATAYARRKGLDGIEIDWEFPGTADRVGFNRLINCFRHALDVWQPRGTLIGAVFQAPWAMFGYDRDSLVACFDQINLMTYELYPGDYSKTLTGFTSPLRLPQSYPDYAGYAIDGKNVGPRAWIAKGYPASKIGLGVSFTTTEFTNVQPPVGPARPYGAHTWGYVKNVPQEGRHWDETAQVPWEALGTKMVTYEDTTSCRLKVEYAKQLGLGGIMIYELGSGYLPDAPNGKKDQLLTSIRDALWGRPLRKK